MCWVSWERNEIKEAQGVSKSRRLIGGSCFTSIYGGRIDKSWLIRHPFRYIEKIMLVFRENRVF
jgi:hypothetical protein